MSGNVHAKSRLSLEHVRAVVLTQAWSGAYTTKLLADMGAEVIQIESLTRIDPWRGGFPSRLTGTYPNGEPGERPYDRNAAFNSVNTSKLGITLDLNTAEGKDIFLKLVSLADMVVENFSARVITNFGLDYPVLRSVNPSVIMLRTPTYGCYGPYSMYPGNGGTTEPMSGISSLLGYRGGPPINSGFMHTDPVAGMLGLASLLIALHYRAITGQGQLIDMSQQETSIGLIADEIMEHTMTGRPSERRENRDRHMAPHGNYPCRGDDTWVAIAVRSDDEWRALCAIMEKPGLASDTRFATLSKRLEYADELDEIVSTWTVSKESNDVMGLLQAEGIPCAPLANALELLDNPQLKSRGFFETVTHPDTGTVPMAGMPWKMSRTPGRIRFAAPRLGEHSVEVLKNYLGMPDTEILSLVERGITGDTPSLDD